VNFQGGPDKLELLWSQAKKKNKKKKKRKEKRKKKGKRKHLSNWIQSVALFV